MADSFRFIGMDMLAEPEPFPPPFVREWERRLRLSPPHSSVIEAFDRELRAVWKEARRAMSRSPLLFEGWPYETPPEQQARYELRQAQRRVKR